MALVIDLKPGEKILIGKAVITNDSQRTRMHIAGDAPILREKDVIQEEDADTPCKKIYFLLQCMYIDQSPQKYHTTYFDHVRDVQKAAPSCLPFFVQINEQIIQGHYYKALKLAKELIDHERELMGHVLQKSEQ